MTIRRPFERDQLTRREIEARYREQMKRHGDGQWEPTGDLMGDPVDAEIDADYHDEISYDEVEDAPEEEDV
jgi:hypothetical protein